VTILDEILAHRRAALERQKRALPPAAMRARAEAVTDPVRPFRTALMTGTHPRIIAELKRRSPSRGEIRPNFDVAECATAYAAGGAAALSVLTEEHYFGGSLENLQRTREAVTLPLLRKDFIVDPYQIDEARVAGADAVLLIAAALELASLRALQEQARARGLTALVEIHDEAELELAVAVGADTVGINNRDLGTFAVDLGVTERLAPKLPHGTLVVAESGIFTPEDVERLEAAGAHACLVGESLMRERDLAHALRKLRRMS